MDYTLTTQFQEYLGHHERLIWVGQPQKGLVFRAIDKFIIPFSLLWCGILAFWIVSVINQGASLSFTMLAIPFVVVGLIVTFGRFIIDAKLRANTFYGLTNERIIIKSGIKKKSIKTINISPSSNIEYYEKADGSGSINIDAYNNITASQREETGRLPGLNMTPTIELIQDVRTVYNKIIKVQKSKETAS